MSNYRSSFQLKQSKPKRNWSLIKLTSTNWSETLVIQRRKLRKFFLLGIATGAVLTFLLLLISGSARNLLPNSSGANEVAGQVALTEGELINLVKSKNVTAYWVGPINGMKYALTITTDNQVFVKYLPNGEGINDLKPNYKVIATYPEQAAYDITRAAGTQSNAISFINSDGAAVYYSKDRATNVYVAYTGQPYEIEVFDPDAAVSLESATKPGGVVLIK
mgnify:CR=1 FL=1